MSKEIVDYMTDGFWEYFGGKRHTFNVKPGGTLTVNITGLEQNGMDLAIGALETWTMVSGINFEFTNSPDAHIIFDDNEPGAFSASTVSDDGSTIIQSYVNVSIDWLLTYGIQFDSYSYTTYIHEIGHALGLGHPGPYNGGHPNAFVDTISFYDSWQVSVMSYINQTETIASISPAGQRPTYAHPVTPMVADIEAIHELYGEPENINAGDTIYGRGANMGGRMERYFKSLTGEGNPFFGLKLAGHTKPTFHDVDNDGDLDLTTLSANQHIIYDFENVGTVQQPKYVFSNATDMGQRVIDYEVGDFDADGDIDVVLALSDGLYIVFVEDGEIASIDYYEVYIERNYNMELVDIDGDGDLDLFEIDSSGVYFFENVGTKYQYAFDLDNYLHEPGAYTWVKTFEFADADNDGDYDIVGADYQGYLYYEENIGNSRNPLFSETRILINPLEKAVYSAAIPPNLLSEFAFGDIDGDNDVDFFALDVFGDVYYFENQSTSDTLHYEPTSFHTKTTFTIVDTDGYDTINLSTDTDSQSVDLNPMGVSNVYGQAGNMIIGPDTYIERYYAGSNHDFILGNSVRNLIFGGAGDDIIKGNDGNDSLVGGTGNDWLIGGPGNDWIYGRQGSDQLDGGPGRDTFVFSPISDNDRIVDFGDGKDRLHLAAFETIETIEDITIFRSGTNTVVDLSDHGGGQIQLIDYTDALTANDFYFG